MKCIWAPWTTSFTTPCSHLTAFPFGRGETVCGLGDTKHMEGMGTLFLKWGDESLFIYRSLRSETSPSSWLDSQRVGSQALHFPSSLEEYCPLGADQLRRSDLRYSCVGSPGSSYSEAQELTNCSYVLGGSTQLWIPRLPTPLTIVENIHTSDGNGIVNSHVLKLVSTVTSSWVISFVLSPHSFLTLDYFEGNLQHYIIFFW